MGYMFIEQILELLDASAYSFLCFKLYAIGH